MVMRDTVPDLFRPKPRKPTRTLWVVLAVVCVVVAAAVAVGVQLGTSSSSSSGSSSPAGVSIPAAPAKAAADEASAVPVAGRQYAGSAVLTATAAQLTTWNSTSTFCQEDSWEVPDGSVSTDSKGDAVLAVSGKSGSCVGLISPQTYASGVIEVYAYFPALPGKPDTIADWTSVWLSNESNWPADGEIDAVEAEPATGTNAVSYHWGSPQQEDSVSTDGFAADGNLPTSGPNLTPGWHVVDIAFSQGFFNVYYDGKLFVATSDSAITGAAKNLYITTSVTADNSAVIQKIGKPPVNSDSSPAAVAVKYVKAWSFK